MKHQALQIIQATKKLLDQYGNVDEGLLALLLEKDMEKILGAPKFDGCWVRVITEGELSIGHPEAEVWCKKTASNAVAVYLKPFERTGKVASDKVLDTIEEIKKNRN